MPESRTRKIIIDTDPGQDDAIAILAALASPELEVVGITTVAGNVPLELTERNARVICELAGHGDAKVYAGHDRPLVRPLVTAEEVHGSSGLDGISLPEPTMELQAQHAVDFIVESILSNSPGSITLCPLGPLTNIAAALHRAPGIAPRIKEIVLMGGAYFEVGNVTPAAEFNIYVDPEAADAVFRSGIQLTTLPLDVTHKAIASPDRVEAFRAIGTRAGSVVADWLKFYREFDFKKYGINGAPLHDPCVIAYILRPKLFSGKLVNVVIETGSDLTRGMTVADWWRVTDRKPNAMFIGDVDADGYFKLLTELVARL